MSDKYLYGKMLAEVTPADGVKGVLIRALNGALMSRVYHDWETEIECLNGNWSKRELQRQIGSLLYERTALSTDKAAVIERARQQSTETPSRMADLIRDPYVLEFVGLAECPGYTESELESALLDHLQKFLLELGTGFCFEARQKRITVGNEHDYIDLVFYGKDATKVEYATAGMDQQLFVSRYLVALPSADQLRRFIETDRAALESSGAEQHDAKDEDTP